ncbi:DedA family protein [Bifidobacterium jacchi]|uniref:DedA family protein n=1 Tax=Bifidobacterium jacchi TaxID=2490545 RepID=A0A5N5RJV0_9BIFI|nr:DedA family protein [Bifidobacterium jacchi]KAB5607554.1 DedA family protein [Bifidobacterium jacchi]
MPVTAIVNDITIAASQLFANGGDASPIPVCTTGETGIIGSITDWLVGLMETIGGIGVALAIALESIFPPIPSEVILPLAGFTAARGTLNLVEAIIWATVGSLLGAWALYGIARWVGLHRIHKAADKIPGVSRHDVNKANEWFTKYGTWSVLIGRVIPVVRSLISIPAGFNRMNFIQFSGWTLLGSAVWNTILVSAGYMLGDSWCSILGVLGVFEDVVIVVFIVAIVGFIAYKIRSMMKERNAKG